MTVQAGFAQGIPAHLIVPAVFIDVFFMRLMRPVRGRVGQIEKEGFILFTFLNKANPIIRKRIGRVVRTIGGTFHFGHRLIAKGNPPALPRVCVRREKASGPGEAAIELIEPALQWPLITFTFAQMPLARQIGGIARRTKQLPDRGTLTI